MKYAAKIENGAVTAVITVSDEQGVEWAINTFGGNWLETWADGGRRKNYAGIGYAYDAQLDAFIPPKPYASWVLDEETFQWEAPVPMPPGGPWDWDEATQSWVAA